MLSKSIRKGVVAVSCLLALGTSASAMATAHIMVPANQILLQNQIGTTPVLFFAGSGCSNGHLNLDPTQSSDREKLLWATILSAKASGVNVSFDYDMNGDICYIRNFSVEPN
ncbi:MAG: hypothetical protein WBW32_01295 [Luteibacter sp.]